MTEIGGVKDISRQRIWALADAAVENVRNAIRPIYGSALHGSPEHFDGTIYKDKAEADTSHEHFDGKTTE